MNQDLKMGLVFPLIVGLIVLIFDKCWDSKNSNESPSPTQEISANLPEDTTALISQTVITEIVKPKLLIMPESSHRIRFNNFNIFLGWVLFIIAVYCGVIISTSVMAENDGCAPGCLGITIPFLASFFIFKYIGIWLKLFSFIYAALIYERLLNFIYSIF